VCVSLYSKELSGRMTHCLTNSLAVTFERSKWYSTDCTSTLLCHFHVRLQYLSTWSQVNLTEFSENLKLGERSMCVAELPEHNILDVIA